MMMQVIPLLLELIGKGNIKKSPGLWTNCTCRCKHLRHQGYKIRHLGSNVHVCHGRGEQESNFARYLYIEIMQITCNKLHFVAVYWDTASVQNFCN